MKKSKKLIAIVLAIAMMITIIPAQAFAQDYNSDVTNGAIWGDDSDVTEPVIVAEDTRLREENVKHFRCEDGSYILADYGYPVHSLDGGEWEDIDNTLTEAGSAKNARSIDSASSSYVNSNGTFTARFPKELSENNAVTVSLDNFSLTMGLLKASGTAVLPRPNAKTRSGEKTNDDFLRLDKLTSSVTYENVYSGTDVEYIVTPTGMKENIIVKEPQASYVYAYNISANGLTLTLQDDGSVLAFNENGETVYMIESPYMFDSAGEDSTSVQVALTADENGYILTYTPDIAWMNDSARQFPVTVDPSIIVEIKKADIHDSYINSKESGYTFNNQWLCVGNNGGYGTDRAFLKFDLPVLPHCSMINYASLSLAYYDKKYDAGSAGKQVYSCVYELGTDVDLDKITWKNQPTQWLNGNVIDYVEMKAMPKENPWQTWNITSAVKKWYEDGENTGLGIKSSDESLYRCTVYHTSNYGVSDAYPTLIVSYTNNIGLEGYWTYHNVGNGRSGAASINDYNGALVYVHDDISMNGNRLPINISHVYNMDKNDEYYYNGGYMSAGVGWRLNIRERIVELSNFPDIYKPLTDVGYTIKYFDPDGTVKFFKSNAEGNYYEYDDKLKLKVVGNTSSAKRYAMSDETGNIKYFDYNGRLSGIKDSNGNEQTVNYDASGRISSVTDPVKRQVTFKYDGIMLTSITDPAGRVTSYEYTTINSKKYLAKIIYPDGKFTTFEYDSDSNLTKVVGTDGTHSEFSYKDVAVPGKTNFRITNAEFYGSKGTLQNSYAYTYSPSGTKVEDNFGHSETMLFDAAGRTVCVTDENGRAFYGDYNKSGNKNNTLKYQSDMQQTITNLVKNSGAEVGTKSGWYFNGLETNGGNYRIDTAEKAHGLYSFKLYSASDERINYRQDLTVEPGKTYTLSAQIKTKGTLSGAGGAFLGLVYQKPDGSINYVKSELVKTTENWERYTVTFTYPEDYTTLGSVMMGLDNAQGSVWFDDVQLEEGAVANRYNMLSNGSMEMLKDGALYGWSTENCNEADGITDGKSGNGFKITGEIDKVKSIYQDFGMSGKKGHTIVAGAWAKSNSVLASGDEDEDAKKCVLAITVTYLETPEGKDSNVVTDRFEFPSMSDDWQYISHAVTALGAYENVRIALEYRNNMNTVIFDDADFYIDSYGTKYEYDDDGRIISGKDSAGQEYKYTYDGPDLTKIEFEKNGEKQSESTYEYDDNHNMTKSTSDAGVITEYVYGGEGVNTYGNVTKITVKNADGTLQSSSSCKYTTDYNYQTEVTDARGETVKYNYDTVKGLLNSSTDPKGNVTKYTYDANTDVLLTTSGQNVTNGYAYDKDQLLSITHNGFEYNFGYDEFGRPTETKVGNQLLSTSEYNENGTLKKSLYGNGDYVEPVYNSLDQIVAKKYNGDVRYEWEYGSNGQIGRYIDRVNNISYRYDYDLAGRVKRVYGSDGFKLRNIFDDKGNVYNTLFSFENNDYIKAFSNDYVYGKDNRIEEVHFNQTNTDINRTYDDIGRITKKEYNKSGVFFSTDYAFVDGIDGNVTGVLSEINNNGEIISYTYDANGNITTISDNGMEKVRYYYDGLNQLIREDNKYINKTIEYIYDVGGNILEKKEYTYTAADKLGTALKTIPYSYTDLNWKDKLAAYDGKTITYDEIGNPLTFDGNSFSWTGRQLDSISGNGKDISYKYNAEGIRTEKTVNGKTTKYYLEGNRIVLEKTESEEHAFFYDGDGNAAAFVIYDSQGKCPYYYMRNAQGDVIGLFDQTGNVVARYTYDSWGKLISITDGVGNDKTNDTAFVGYKNPLRYRGYYYDNETALYYLQSRYYNPEIGRFLNADVYASTGQGVLGSNVFAYCLNNPIIRVDAMGTCSYCSPVWVPSSVIEHHKKCNITIVIHEKHVGAAEPYIYVPGSNDPNAPNCYAYAIGSFKNEQPGNRSGVFPTHWNDVKDVGKSVEADLKSMGKTVRIIVGPNAEIADNEFRIAFRVGTKPCAYSSNGKAYYDYHFMRQTNTGQWAEKHGIGGESILWSVGMTPDTIPWTLGGIPYYDSSIIYYAVGK